MTHGGAGDISRECAMYVGGSFAMVRKRLAETCFVHPGVRAPAIY